MDSTQHPSPAHQRLVGTWDVKIATPIGSIETEYTFSISDGLLGGEARYRQEVTQLTDLAVTDVDGVINATWNQKINKPMRLNLSFEVTVHDNDLSGTSKAGRLPKSTVHGSRRTSR